MKQLFPRLDEDNGKLPPSDDFEKKIKSSVHFDRTPWARIYVCKVFPQWAVSQCPGGRISWQPWPDILTVRTFKHCRLQSYVRSKQFGVWLHLQFEILSVWGELYGPPGPGEVVTSLLMTESDLLTYTPHSLRQPVVAIFLWLRSLNLLGFLPQNRFLFPFPSWPDKNLVKMLK